MFYALAFSLQSTQDTKVYGSIQQTDSQALISLQLALQKRECRILSGFEEFTAVPVLLIAVFQCFS